MIRTSNRLSVRWRALSIALCFLGLVLLGSACEKRRQPGRYLIPKGYVGWVLIELNVAGAPSPREEDGFIVFEIPPSGRLAIPGTMETGWGRDEYYYADESGARELLSMSAHGEGGMIWGGGLGSYEETDGPRIDYEKFFVGTEKELEEAPRPIDRLQSIASERRS